MLFIISFNHVPFKKLKWIHILIHSFERKVKSCPVHAKCFIWDVNYLSRIDNWPSLNVDRRGKKRILSFMKDFKAVFGNSTYTTMLPYFAIKLILALRFWIEMIYEYNHRRLLIEPEFLIKRCYYLLSKYRAKSMHAVCLFSWFNPEKFTWVFHISTEPVRFPNVQSL